MRAAVLADFLISQHDQVNLAGRSGNPPWSTYYEHMCETSRVLLEGFVAARRRIAAEHAQMLTLLAEFAALDRDELNPDGEYSHLEIAAVAGVSERYARCLLDLAETVTTRLPGTLAALRVGETDLYRVQRIAEATDVLSDELAAQVEAELLTGLAAWSPRQLNYRLRKAVDRADPQAAQVRAVARQEARCVSHASLDDGAGLLQIQGDVERTELAYQRVRSIAKQFKAAGDSRTLDQITTDVALDCLAGKGFEHGKVHVWLTLPATTALGVDDKSAYLAGYGWLPAQRALRLAAQDDATWQRVLTDPGTGQVVDVGRHRYRPPAALRDRVRARDATCTAPGCARPAHMCDLDHVVPFPDGPTHEQNIAPACRSHHRAKTHGGWQTQVTGDGGLLWTTKHGYNFRHRPEPIADPEPTESRRSQQAATTPPRAA